VACGGLGSEEGALEVRVNYAILACLVDVEHALRNVQPGVVNQEI
jgi:hypothetical protein